MRSEHSPDPEFVNRLEWELQSIMRRRASVNGASGGMRLARSRLYAVLAVALLSICMGAAGTYAAMNRIDGRNAALHVARAEALLELAQARLGRAAAEFGKAQTASEKGGMTDRESRHAEAQLVQAQSDVAIHELALEETRITGKPPNDALSAPNVKGRDFVAERLVARRRPLQLRLELVNARAQRREELAGTGSVTHAELAATRAQVAEAEQELRSLDKRIALRESFLAGDLSPTEVELEGMRLAAVTAREMAVRHMELMVNERNRLASLLERSLVSPSELAAADAALHEVQAQVELTELELSILDQKLEDAAAE